jgi:hypothetical protein
MRIIIFEDDLDHCMILRKIVEEIFQTVDVFPKEENSIHDEDNEYEMMRKSFSNIYSDNPDLENQAWKFYRDIAKIEPSDYIILDYKLASNGKNGLDIYERLSLENKAIVFTGERAEKFKFIEKRIENNSAFKNIIAIEKGTIDNLSIPQKNLYIMTIKMHFLENEILKKQAPINKPLKAFICYSKKDGSISKEIKDFEDNRNYLQEFKTTFSALTGHNKTLELWSDTSLLPSEDWNDEIIKNITEADIHFLLVSDNLLESRYIKEVELNLMFKKYKEGKSLFIPIYIKHSGWQLITKYKTIQGFPVEGQALDAPKPFWNSKSQMYDDLRKCIISIIEKFNPQTS